MKNNTIPTEKARIIRTLARVYEDKPEEFVAYCRDLGYTDATISAGLLKYYNTEKKSDFVFVIVKGKRSAAEVADEYEAARTGALREEFMRAFKLEKGQEG